MVHHKEISYIRLTREKTPVLYDEKEEFPIGGCKIHNLPISKSQIKAVIIGAGITVHVALKAQKILAKKGVFVTVVDLYSIKPIDAETLQKLVKKTPHVIVAEDHYEFGGIGEAVLSAFSKFPFVPQDKQTSNFKFTHLCVKKLPRSGTPHELLHFEHLDEMSMVNAVSRIMQ